MALNIAIWADGRAEVGAGHLVRSRVVGEALQARGHRVSWFSNSDDGALSWAWEGLSSRIFPANSLREFDVCIVDGYDEKIDLNSDNGVVCRIHDGAMMPLPQADVWIDHGPSAHPQQHPESHCPHRFGLFYGAASILCSSLASGSCGTEHSRGSRRRRCRGITRLPCAYVIHFGMVALRH